MDRVVFCSECAAGRDRERTREAQRRRQAATTTTALADWRSSAASLEKRPYTHVNSRGQVFYLHAREVIQREGTHWRSYYFALAPKAEEVVEELPAEYVIVENPVSQLPLLKRPS